MQQHPLQPHRQEFCNMTSIYPSGSTFPSFSSTTQLVDNPFSVLPSSPESSPSMTPNINRLWSEIQRINANLPAPFQIERIELEQLISHLNSRYDQIDRPELAAKHISGLRHSCIIGKDADGEVFLLIKPNMTNRRYMTLTHEQKHSSEAQAVIACGATKMTKKGAVMIRFSGQNLFAEEFLTYSSDTDNNKDQFLERENGDNAIRDGWKELRFWDPQKNRERIIYIMPNLGKEIDDVFSTLEKEIQSKILFELIQKAKDEKPFDVKLNNILVDRNNTPHFIDGKDQTFRYTPYLHLGRGCGYETCTSEKTTETARILCLTYAIWELFNNDPASSSFENQIFAMTDGARNHNPPLTEVTRLFQTIKDAGCPLSEELRKAYLSCLTFDQLESALHQLLDAPAAPEPVANTGIKRWFSCCCS